MCHETAGFFGFFGQRGTLSPLNTPDKGKRRSPLYNNPASLKVLSRALSDFGVFLFPKLKRAGSRFRIFPPQLPVGKDRRSVTGSAFMRRSSCRPLTRLALLFYDEAKGQ